jgi:hypothetical protein
VFFVEARYHNSPSRAGRQVKYIAHREEGLTDGRSRELYGIGARYRAFRGDERAIQKALVEDGRGLKKPVYFRFILTVDNRTAERFARLDGLLAERVIRDAVQKTFHGAARGVQGVFAIHQHGGEDRPAHPHVHALLSPRLENRAPIHISPKGLERIKRRWEVELLRTLARQERRLEHAREMRTPLTPPSFERLRELRSQRPLLPARHRRPLGPIGLAFLRTRRTLGLAGRGRSWLYRWVRGEPRVNAIARNPERWARQATFRLFAGIMPRPMRDALWVLRGLRDIGLRGR